MKKTVDFLGWVLVVCTILALICTLLTTYNLSYIKHFSTYRILQICISCTMLIWALKMLNINSGRRKWAYSFICLSFSVGTIFFMVFGEVW